jgi:hypothetical protein
VQQSQGRYGDETSFDFMSQAGVWFENFALPAVINECLLQSYHGELRLFPNWSADRTAEFRTLRAIGAFLVSARFEAGRVQWIEVTSEVGGPLRVINPWGNRARLHRDDDGNDDNGVARVITGATLQIDTNAGEFLRLEPENDG